jgi:hypothetical protein
MENYEDSTYGDEVADFRVKRSKFDASKPFAVISPPKASPSWKSSSPILAIAP